MKELIMMLALCGATATLVPLQAEDPPSDLLVQGVPKLIPDTFLQKLSPYQKLRGNMFLSWDPKSGGMLIAKQGDETIQIYTVASPEAEPKLVAPFPENITGATFMPKQGDRIVFAADHNGDEYYQLYGLDPATGKAQMLTDGMALNADVIYDHEGKQIAFLSNMPKARLYVIYAMDPRDPDSRKIVMQPDNHGWMLQDWAHDGHHFLMSHDDGEGGFLWQVSSSTGETKLLNPVRETQLQLFLQAVYTPDDKGLYVIVTGPAETFPIGFFPLDPGASGKVPKDVTYATDMELSPDGKWLAYVNGKEGEQELHLFNTVTGEEEPKIPQPQADIMRIRWNEDSTQLGFAYGSADQPDESRSYNVSTHQLTEWTKPEEVIPATTQVKPELVKIRSFDDLEISGYLYMPDAKKFPGKRPVLVCIHGGPETKFTPGFLGPYNFYLNELGVALFYPNVRGSGGFGGHFEELDDGYKREDAVKDIGAFLDWIAANPRLDGNRIGVQGGSYGGYMVLSALYHYGNQLRCGSDLMGITNFVTFLHNTATYRQASRRMEYGDERVPEMKKFLESISPLNHVAEIHDPVLIAAGKNDPRVPESESDQMVKALQAQNGIVWSIVGEDEGHGFKREADRNYLFAAEAYFFQTYLLPETRLTPLGPVTSKAPETTPAVVPAITQPSTAD